MRIICIIPARYESTRFPGKPLADLWQTDDMVGISAMQEG